MIPVTNSQRILVVKLDHIGDFALAIPALKTLADRVAPLSVDLVVSRWNVAWKSILPWIGNLEVIQFTPYLTAQHPKTSRLRLIRDLIPLAFRLRSRRYTAAVDLRTVPSDWRGKLIARLSGAPIRVGAAGAGDWLLTHKVIDTAVHESDRHLERLRIVAPGLEKATGPFRHFPKGAAPSRILLHPGAGLPCKLWPVAHWARLTRLLSGHLKPPPFTFIGGPGDKGLLTEIARATTLPVDRFVCSSSLEETLGHISSSKLLIGLDSAAPHLASLTDTPVITLFSAVNDPARWAALGRNTLIHHPDPSYIHFDPNSSHISMESITPEEVFAAVIKTLESLPESKGLSS